VRYFLSPGSEERLGEVKPALARVVRRAIDITSQDFTVFEGLRTLERQRELVQSGASRTLNSKHLTGDAVDLVPWIAGKPQWQMHACIRVAQAMREASDETGTRLRWGSCWDLALDELDPAGLEREVVAYTTRYHLAHPNKHPLIDGPHFELLT
jgi:peptidoglycan L-alanyl-D-glutamate endopeptidase CwlK